MNTIKNKLAVLLTLLLVTVLLPERAAAENVEDTWRYSVMLSGANTITIKMPVYDEEGADDWVDNGYLKASWTDANGTHTNETVIWWSKDEDSHDNDDSDLWCKFYTNVGGSFDVTQGNSSSHFTLTKGDGTLRRKIYENNDGNTYDITIVWRVPYDMLGCKVKFSWDVKCDYTNGLAWDTHYSVSPSGADFTLPKAQSVVSPQITLATISYSEVGKLELPWFMGSTELTSIYYKYTDANGNTVKQTLPSNENSGTIYLDATEPHNNFGLVVSYKDNNNYLIENISSETQDLTMVHAPVGFTATPVGNSKAAVRLNWYVEHTGTNDITSSDFFEVQRSLTGEEADFVTIGSVPYAMNSDTHDYEYVDSTLINAITAEQLVKGGTLDKLTYRVRRMLTQSWGWDGNPCAATASCVVDDLHLRRISTYSAKWQDERAYTVRVAWDYANEYGAVWDSRAKVLMRVTSTDRSGAVVENTIYELSEDEIDQRYKVVTLARPCVKYDIEVYVDRATSPINLLENVKEFFFPIRNADDWNTFRIMVSNAKGQSDVNARLYADISTSASCGDSDSPFRGRFDGNGHTLNINIDYSSGANEAPFKVGKDYTIENLRVTGTIKGGIHSAGLVGSSSASDGKRNTIRNVRVSATVECSNSYVGGIVGHGGRSSHYINNCLFDGKLICKGSNAYGGAIIGWCDDNSGNWITNCLENGTYEGLTHPYMNYQYKSGGNIAYSNGAQGSNNWSVHSWGHEKYADAFIINNAEDWNTFCSMVKAAAGNYDVNAVLNADISISSSTTSGYYAGMDTYPYRGTFDGNGHTMRVDIDWGTNYYAAPFPTVNKATIKNLYVRGYVKGGIHSAGLIGHTYGSSPSIIIENVYVGTDVTTTASHAGGIIGHAHSATVKIEDCKSWGDITAKGSNAYCGSIIGWADNANNWEMHRVAEYVSFTDVAHAGFSYYNPGTPWGYNSKSTTCVSAHSWGEVKAEYRNKYSSDAAVIFNQEQPGSWVLDAYSIWMPAMETDAFPSVDDLLASLGHAWVKDGSNAVLLMTSVDRDVLPTYTKPTLPDFYHESFGKVDKTLMTQTRQSSVLLAWETDGNPVDYFEVLRRAVGTTAWDTIATDLDNMSYEDIDVSPLVDYEYKVRGANDCEGMSYSETAIAKGACKHSGKVEGYIRFLDGTGAPGITVEIVSGSTKVTAVTDETGYYMADDLSYLGQQSVTYDVTPVSTSGIKLEVESYAATFNDKSNHEMVHEFTITNSHLFTGFVMYEGTSIPVKGVRFRVNGSLLHNAKDGYVESDFEGKFSFNVLDGNNIIQAEMDGHKFVDDGYFKSKDGFVFNDNVSQIYFYDATKVKLTGRVVGGNDQGKLPLDNNLSRNNLGDDLTMVLTLEGDNTSWLVYDNQNPTLTKREDSFAHPGGGGHKTTAEVLRKRMVVKPDTVTGEYVLMLPPVRWKVQQIYCEGYPTLFQDGMVSEVIDLTNSLKTDTVTHEGTFVDVDKKNVSQPTETYNAIYNRIYHAPVEITYRQVGYDTFDYFGDKSYTATNVGGDKVVVPLAYLGSDNKADYTFGHPVFSLERRYPIEIAVVERYPWNGVAGSAKEDLVRVGGGRVTIHNGLKDGLNQEFVELDSEGRGLYYLQAGQTTRLLTDKDALRTVTMTLEQDGTTYEAEPLRGYILNMFATGAGKEVLVNGQPLLFDILRDPPGSGSSATLSKGSTLKYTYTLDMKLQAGLHLNIVTGSTMDNFQGTVAAPQGAGGVAGIINSSNSEELIDFTYAFDMEGRRAFAYTMNINQDISTSTDRVMVGADADLYIGTVQNIVVEPVSTIRAIPDAMYQQMLGKLGGGSLTGVNNKYGTLVHIAEGTDADGKKYHLVRDESIGYGPEVTSHFVHSQKHILTELIPAKVKELRALMFTGSKADAQAKANATRKPVYWTDMAVDDDLFGSKYEMVKPEGSSENFTDEALQIYQIIEAWVQMIAQNEREKLQATDRVANYDVDGGSKVQYSEQFKSDYDITNYYHLPGIISATYFDESGTDMGITVASIVGVKIVSAILKAVYDNTINSSTSAVGAGAAQGTQNANGFNTAVNFYGSTFKFSLLPVLDYNVKDVSGESKSYNRKESFNIVMDKRSHLNFDVYRVWTDTTTVGNSGVLDVYTNQNFNKMTNYVAEYLHRDNTMADARYARSFVYRTRGGATVNTWEDERRTLFYNEGTILDERTKKICNPKITLDRQSVSGVAVGDPARFKVYLTNESEQPEAATDNLTLFTFFLDEASNPAGAKFFVDGSPLNGNGIPIVLNPGIVVEKTIEVYAGNGFDYNGLTIGVASSSDFVLTQNKVMLDVHYLRQAGPVNISSPGDKWIMNTDAQWNDKHGWFLTITIDGFNKYQHTFDHIEFQYKESLRGDDYWTNLCSYYADSTLMAKASGVCDMIPENGNIVTQFYGEGTVMEKAYDLRAVLYCRDGNSFLTTSSAIISGVKDTRRPQLFGTPEPTDGILTAGSNIIFNFSEDIEHNYLNAITNFEVKGEVNNDNVSESVSVQFDGTSSVESEAQRNFSGKSVTIDMMVKPDATGRDMPLFSHGTNGKKLQLWLTGDLKLKAVVDEQEFTSNEKIAKGGFTQVAMSINHEDSTLTFYNGGVEIGQFKMKEPYHGTGALIFGRTNETDRTMSQYYKGRMMEARLWYRALTGGQVGTTYGNRRLTGYEMGLVDYYPMNEGSSVYALDHTQGANAQLMGASWAIPRGLSLHIENDGFALKQNAINRTAEQDYTLTFWFKTDDENGTLVCNGNGNNDVAGAENQFWLGFDGGQLHFRSNGQTFDAGSGYNDNQWHHYAMTVNRARGVVNIYVDQTLKATFSPDLIGGISGGTPTIGSDLTGYFDEFCMFQQALPLTLIKTYATKSPQGDEAGLLTYLSFDTQERQKDNDIELVAYPYSKKIYLDEKGNVKYSLDPLTKEATSTPVRDYVFVASQDEIMKHITNETAAPVVPYEELKNLNYSFVGKDNQIYVGIDELASRINHRNIYITLRDIEDKNGNAMASPATASYYVTNSSLQWVINCSSETTTYGREESLYMTIYNSSALSHTYSIENCPKWLTLDNYSDVIGPQTITSVMAKVNKNLNVGKYDEIIYLVDEEGNAEPYYLNLTVEGEQPDWAWNVDSDLLEYSMNIAGRVYLNGEIDIDSRDIVGVFDKENRCHGFANVDYSAQTGETGVYLTVYDNQASGRDLYFKLWQYSTGLEILLAVNGERTMTFEKSAVHGVDTPVRFDGGDMYIQVFDLKAGWNWISFNVANEALADVNNLLSGLPWKDGDVLTDMNSDLTLVYRGGRWLSTDNVSDIRLSPQKSYAIKVKEDISFPIGGSIIRAVDQRTVSMKQGWNGIGYTPMMNLSIETALSDYYDKAEPGDVIKSHDEFAYFTVSGGVGRWRGSLQYMKPGIGYMMLRHSSKEASFTYPFYEPGSTFIDEWAYTSAINKSAMNLRSTMSLSAVVEGFELAAGDRIVAYAGEQQCGIAETSDEVIYMSIEGEGNKTLWFAIERDGCIVAKTDEQMSFRANGVLGSPDEPVVIRFESEMEDGPWYSIIGVKWFAKPAAPGLYIHNGKKVLIK